MKSTNLIGKSTLTFDCYGTLIDWERGVVDTFRMLGGNRIAQISDSDLIDEFLKVDLRLISGPYQTYSDILKTASREVLANFGIRISKDDEATFVSTIPSWPLFPETLQCLEWFAQQFRLAIISNIDDCLIEQTLNGLPIPFVAVVTSEQARSYKPAPEIFELALKVMAEDPEKTVHIAEGLCEAIPARQLGMGSIWVRRTERSDDGSSAAPDLTVTSLTSLVDLLKDRSLL